MRSDGLTPVRKKVIYIGAAVVSVVLFVTIAVVDPWQIMGTSSLADSAEQTTAALKSMDVGPAYLRLEQVRSEVTARFILTCFDGHLYLYAGIVTSPEMSASIFEKATWNYLEIDSDEVLRGQGTNGAEVADSTIWITRPLDEGQAAALKKAKMLGAWTEDGGDFRWGAYMNIDNVRADVIEYVEKCR